MNRLDSMRMRRKSSFLAACLGSLGLLLAAPGAALAAGFDASVGFDPATIGPADLVIDLSVPLFDANDPAAPGTTDVELLGSTDLCILIGASNSCSDTVFVAEPAPITFLVTVTIGAINNPGISGPFTLVLRDLNPNQGYDRSFVTVDGDYAPIPGLVTNGFDFDPSNGINGFDPFIVIQDNVSPTDIRYYLGWTVMQGDSVTFRFDLEQGAVLDSLPSFLFSAIPVVIPEPGTALLMGLGLVGLSVAGRRTV